MTEEPYHVCLICGARFLISYILKSHYEFAHKQNIQCELLPDDPGLNLL